MKDFLIPSSGLNRSIEFSALRTKASVVCIIGINGMPTLGADELRINGCHNLEFVFLHAVGAAHIIHMGSSIQPVRLDYSVFRVRLAPYQESNVPPIQPYYAPIVTEASAPKRPTALDSRYIGDRSARNRQKISAAAGSAVGVRRDEIQNWEKQAGEDNRRTANEVSTTLRNS